MDFGLSNEQQMIIDSVKSFVEKELYPHEDEVEKSNKIEDSVVEKIKQKAIDEIISMLTVYNAISVLALVP